MARNLVDPDDGFLRHARYLIHDRDPLCTAAWTEILSTSGVECLPTPARSPNCNCYAERFVRTIKSECLSQFVIFGERHLRHLVKEFVQHYHCERYHQGIGSRIIRPSKLAVPANDNKTPTSIRRRSRLGGLLNYYYREVA